MTISIAFFDLKPYNKFLSYDGIEIKKEFVLTPALKGSGEIEGGSTRPATAE